MDILDQLGTDSVELHRLKVQKKRTKKELNLSLRKIYLKNVCNHFLTSFKAIQGLKWTNSLEQKKNKKMTHGVDESINLQK